MRWAGQLAGTAELRNAYNILVRQQERERLFRIPCSKQVKNIKVDHSERTDRVDWIQLTEDRDKRRDHEEGNETSSSAKRGKIDWLSGY
jgi:hypothetical protein